MAALPPPFARARHLLLATLAAAAVGAALGTLVHAWPAPEPFPAPRHREPIAPPVVIIGNAGPQCLRFLDHFIRHPNWELTVSFRHVQWCSFEGPPGPLESMTISSTGHATYTRDGERRAMFLPPTLIARLHAVAGASCKPSTDEFFRFAAVHWGPADAPAKFAAGTSDAFVLLDAFVTDAFNHVVDDQRAPRRPQWSLSRSTSK